MLRSESLTKFPVCFYNFLDGGSDVYENRGPSIVAIMVTAAVAMSAGKAWGTYSLPGQGLLQISCGSVSNGALYMQSNNTWDSVTPSGTDPFAGTSFVTPAYDDLVNPRLVLTVWGGSPTNICDMSVAVNGQGIGSIHIGGTGDTNSAFSPTATNVYGSGSGLWLLSIPVPAADLAPNSTNSLSVTYTNTPVVGGYQFDGRIVQATLLSVYQKASLKNTFDYAIAEGSGDIYQTTTTLSGGDSTSRTVSLGPVSTSPPSLASLVGLYTYATSTKTSSLFFDGTNLGNPPTTGSTNYAADPFSYNVTSMLPPNNSVTFSDTQSQSTGALRPELVGLFVTTPVPEPATIALAVAALPGLAVLAWRRRRRATGALSESLNKS